ncbi:MAG TPA: CHAT domain-containing protein [Kofleriaceae bacterium]|nr:CHAT domain-containing protein [Kofleriaceae bacterium]
MILFLAANPHDTGRLALDQEARAIHLELKRSGHRDRFEFVTRWAAEPLDLLRELRELKPTVVHFSGHGDGSVAATTEAANGRDVAAPGTPVGAPGGLYFHSATGGSQVVTPEAIAETFGAVSAQIRLVVLNACDTAPIAEALRAHVDCVVGISGAIHDDTARSFAIGFYGGLGEHESVAAAFKQGRAAINLSGLPDADQPQLKVRDGFDARALILAEVAPALLLKLPCPYPGMRPYQADDAEGFHGRDAEIDELIGRMRAGEREIYVIGPSGSGKSSLVAAGLLRQLARGVTGLGPFVVRHVRPGERPATRLGDALDAPGQPLVAADCIAALLAHRGPSSSVLLVVDQLEELFTLASADERESFLAALRALRAAPRCVVIATLRADFFGALIESSLWPEHPDTQKLSHVEVSPLRGEALREAIVAPALDVGVEVEPALVERLLADAASEPGILPLLQETLVQLWDKRTDQILTLAHYLALGDGERSGLAVAIARWADATMRRLTEVETAIARRILLRMISFGEGRSDTRRQQPRAQLCAAGEDAAEFARVLQTMVGDRLLTVDDDVAGEPRIDLAHEVMISAWPMLAGWIRDHRVDEQRRRQFEEAAVQHGRGARGLLDPIELAEAVNWQRTKSAVQLGQSAQVMALIAASSAAQEARRKEVFWFSGVAGVGLILLLAVISATAIWVALTQEQELQRDVLGTNAYAAHALAGGVAFQLREEVDATVAIAADPAVVQALHTFDVAALDQWRMTTRFDTVALYDRSGIARVQGSPVTNRNRNLGKDYSWRDYFRGARRLGEAGLRAGYISRALLSESEDNWVFGIAAPVYDEGTWAGVLLTTVGTDAALRHKRLDRASDDGPMAVIVAPRDRSRATTEGEGDYVVILHDGLTHGAGIAVDSPRLRELRTTRTERDQLRWIVPDLITDAAHRDPVPGFEGRWLAGFAPVGDTGFVVIVQTRYDAALKPNTRLSRRLVGRGSAVILAWLAACGTFLWVVVRRRRRSAVGRRCQGLPESPERY